MTGAELIAAQLAAQGVRTVFSVAGASHTYLLDALDRAGFGIVSSRHESGAVGEADGYARAMADQRPERPGVALIVGEQGLANAIGGLAVAMAAGSPLLLLIAAPPPGKAEAKSWIDFDQLAMLAPVTKWARVVPSAARLADHCAAALHEALSGRPGPVALVLPQDLFRSDVGAAAPRPYYRALAMPPEDAIADAASLLLNSKRPLAIAGLGAWRGGAASGLRDMAELGIPVLGNGSGRGLVGEDDARGFAWPWAQAAACEADCIVVVGEMLTQRLGFGLPPRFARDARFIQLDVDPAAFERNRPIKRALAGEPGLSLAALVEHLRRGSARWDRGWLAAALAPRRAYMDQAVAAATADIHPVALGRAIAERLPADTQLVGDGADIQNWMYAALRVRRPGGFMDHFPLGAMGSGTALAVGAAAALAELACNSGGEPAMALLVTGDGSIGFHPAELHAAARAGLNLKVIVGNDASWGTEEHGQRAELGRTVNTELGLLPYARLAEGFGLIGYTCDRTADLAAALDALFATDGPALLDVRIDRAAGAALKRDKHASSILFSDLAQESGVWYS